MNNTHRAIDLIPKDFILAYYGKQPDKYGTVTTFKQLFAEIRKLKN